MGVSRVNVVFVQRFIMTAIAIAILILALIMSLVMLSGCFSSKYSKSQHVYHVSSGCIVLSEKDSDAIAYSEMVKTLNDRCEKQIAALDSSADDYLQKLVFIYFDKVILACKIFLEKEFSHEMLKHFLNKNVPLLLSLTYELQDGKIVLMDKNTNEARTDILKDCKLSKAVSAIDAKKDELLSVLFQNRSFFMPLVACLKHIDPAVFRSSPTEIVPVDMDFTKAIKGVQQIQSDAGFHQHLESFKILNIPTDLPKTKDGTYILPQNTLPILHNTDIHEHLSFDVKELVVSFTDGTFTDCKNITSSNGNFCVVIETVPLGPNHPILRAQYRIESGTSRHLFKDWLLSAFDELTAKAVYRRVRKGEPTMHVGFDKLKNQNILQAANGLMHLGALYHSISPLGDHHISGCKANPSIGVKSCAIASMCSILGQNRLKHETDVRQDNSYSCPMEKRCEEKPDFCKFILTIPVNLSRLFLTELSLSEPQYKSVAQTTSTVADTKEVSYVLSFA